MVQLEANLTKMKGLQFQLIEERDKYKAVVIDVIEDKHPTLSKAPTYAGEGRTDEGKKNSTNFKLYFF